MEHVTQKDVLKKQFWWTEVPLGIFQMVIYDINYENELIYTVCKYCTNKKCKIVIVPKQSSWDTGLPWPHLVVDY